MKYIMFKTKVAPNTWMFEPVVFPAMLYHAAVAESMLNLFNRAGSDYQEWEVHSAGFYEGGKCYGESSSLDLASDPRDFARMAAATEGETTVEVDL